MCGLFLEQTKGIKGPNPKVLKLEISKKAMIKSFKQRSVSWRSKDLMGPKTERLR